MSILEIQESAESVATAAKFAGEVFIPGASDMISGNVGSGVATFLASGVVAAALAPTMPVVAALALLGLRVNSFRHATSGDYVWTKALPVAQQQQARPKAG
jgi:hypothetical protein